MCMYIYIYTTREREREIDREREREIDRHVSRVYIGTVMERGVEKRRVRN